MMIQLTHTMLPLLPSEPPAAWASRSTWDLIDQRRKARERAEEYARRGARMRAAYYERIVEILSAHLDPILSRPLSEEERAEEMARCVH